MFTANRKSRESNTCAAASLRRGVLWLPVALFLALSACATRPPADDPQALAAWHEANDPLEPLNRVTFGFNRVVNTVVLEPVAKGYRWVVPRPLRSGIGNALRNLRSPVVFGNDLLQGKGKRAGNTLVRFLINTTLGIGGLFDVATKMGIEGHSEDFGQTLAVWGLGEGPYIVLPIFGPSSPRDGIGMAGDILMDPVYWTIRSTDEDYLNYVRAGLEGIDTLERNLDELEELERSSIDFYAAMRTRYRENRAGEIRDGKEAEIALPDYMLEEELFEEDDLAVPPPDEPKAAEEDGSEATIAREDAESTADAEASEDTEENSEADDPGTAPEMPPHEETDGEDDGDRHD